MIALDPRKQVSYVAISDRKLPENEQVKFILKSLTLNDEAVINDSLFIRSGETVRASMSTQHATAINVGLVDVIGLKDSEGNILTLGYEESPNEWGVIEIKPEFLTRIPASIRTEIARVIIASLEPSAADRKN